MKNLCVFCGSRMGNRPEFEAQAIRLGRMLAERGIGLVYGGGNVGLMGAVADACKSVGGTVIGVIPEALVGREVAGRSLEHQGLDRLEVVDSMHTRKARMAQLADGFIALPGGIGTFEELFEVLTWAQLGFHQKPIGLLNVADYFAPLLTLCNQAVAEGFLSPASRNLLLTASAPDVLLKAMAEYQAIPVKTWIQAESQL